MLHGALSYPLRPGETLYLTKSVCLWLSLHKPCKWIIFNCVGVPNVVSWREQRALWKLCGLSILSSLSQSML